MIKKLFFILLVSTLVLSGLSTFSVVAQPISIAPSELYVEGNIGDLVIKQVLLTNNENSTVNVLIEYNGDTSVFIPNTAIELAPSASRSVNVGFVLEEEEIGWLTYTMGSSQLSQLVIVEIEKTTPSLTVFPSNPKAGSSIAFLITSGDILAAHGFIFCSESGNIYPISIIDGMGTLTLNENETGEAIARIIGDGMNALFANFTIGTPNPDPVVPDDPTPDPSEVLSINVAESVDYSQTRDVTVYRGAMPASLVNVLISKPNGESFQSVTNSFGKISVTFNDVGTWKYSVLTGAGMVSKETTCTKLSGVVSLQTEEPLVGYHVQIDVFDLSTVKISGPNGFSKNDVSTGMSYSFKPEFPGGYTADVESETKKGSVSFDVRSNTNIILTDMMGQPVGYASEKDKTLYIRVVDMDNDPLGFDSVVKIQDANNPFSIPIDVSLHESVGMWTPEIDGVFSISYDGSGFYDGSQATVSVSNSAFSLGFNIWYLIIAIIVIICILAWRGKFIKAWLLTKFPKLQKLGKNSNKTKEPV